MKAKRYQTCLLTLCLLLAALPVAGITAHPTTPPAPLPTLTRPVTNEPFKFGKVDLELLAQINLLDQRFEKEGLVYREATLDAYLDQIGKKLLNGRELENVSWKFRVLRNPAPNAMALPNGSIYITTGLLGLLEEEGQLAGILAHEITHIAERHTYHENRSLRKKVLAINIISAVGTWNPVTGSAGAAIDVIAAVSPIILALSVFGYSKEQEKEADLEGLQMVSQAGYAPNQMVDSFKLLMKDIEGEQMETFYSSHPKTQERINYLSASIKEPADKTSDEQLRAAKAQYLTQMENVARHDIQLAINNGRFRSAVYVSQKLVDLTPDSSDNVFYLAESYRALGPRAPELTAAERTGGGKKKAAKNRNKRTLEEIEAELLKTPAGQEAWKINQKKSEELYLRSLELSRFNSMAHRGLGMLYEKIGRNEEASSEYRKYLELAPNAFDTLRIRRRLQALTPP